MSSNALLAAAAIIFLVGVAHSWLGEAKLIGPLLAPDTRRGMLAHSEFARNVLRFAWHVTTVAWWGLAAIMIVLVAVPVEAQAKAILIVLVASLFLTGLMVLVIARGRHLAWLAIWIAAGLVLVPLL